MKKHIPLNCLMTHRSRWLWWRWDRRRWRSSCLAGWPCWCSCSRHRRCPWCTFLCTLRRWSAWQCPRPPRRSPCGRRRPPTDRFGSRGPWCLVRWRGWGRSPSRCGRSGQPPWNRHFYNITLYSLYRYYYYNVISTCAIQLNCWRKIRPQQCSPYLYRWCGAKIYPSLALISFCNYQGTWNVIFLL